MRSKHERGGGRRGENGDRLGATKPVMDTVDHEKTAAKSRVHDCSKKIDGEETPRKG